MEIICSRFCINENHGQIRLQGLGQLVNLLIFIRPLVETSQLSMVSEITVLVLICSMTGFEIYFFKKGCNFCGMVAEKLKIAVVAEVLKQSYPR